MTPLIGPLLELGGKLIDRLIPDPQAKADAQIRLLEMTQRGELAELIAETELAKGQMDINKAEAGSDGLFKAGWRPFIGWVCGAALCYQYLLKPFITIILMYNNVNLDLPILDDTLWQLLFGMLGLGTLRTVEKLKRG
jgi:hypothetical protein